MRINIKKVIVLQGLPGSGKTTWTKEFISNNPDFVRVNRDDLRNMRTPYWVPEQENMITEWERNCVRDALLAGYSVVIDATNFRKDAVTYWKGVASKFNADFEIKYFDVPVVECIERDAARTTGKVGAKVIMDMYNRYIANRVEFSPFIYDTNLPRAIICDLDGTLAIHNGRGPFELNKCDTDLVNPAVKRIVDSYTGQVIFLSGREDYCREKTINWLHDNLTLSRYPEPMLFMRKTGDKRGDDIVKHEIFGNEILGKYYVEFVLDDRQKVVDMWRKIGLTCMQVAPGDF